jgi:hypothetical protein
MCLAGAFLVWPRLTVLSSLEAVAARDVDAYRLPIGPDQVELAVVFSYPVKGELLGRADADFLATGEEHCDHLGRILPPLILSDAAADDWVQRLRSQEGRWLAYYDPRQPLSSGRIRLQSGETAYAFDALGLSLLVAPPFVWLVLLLIWLFSREANRARRGAL